jgi:hypothetical protein
MSKPDPTEPENQKAGKRQGGNVETKGASKAPPSGDRAEKHGSAGERQPATGEAEKKR